MGSAGDGGGACRNSRKCGGCGGQNGVSPNTLCLTFEQGRGGGGGQRNKPLNLMFQVREGVVVVAVAWYLYTYSIENIVSKKKRM